MFGEVEQDQNLSELLSRYTSDQMIDRIAKTTRHIFDVRKIRSGNKFARITTREVKKKMLFFIYEISDTDFVVYDFRDSLKVYRDQKLVTRKIKNARGTVITSLWNTFVNNGLDINLALKLSDVYAWTIDFYGLQSGDNFKVIYEELSIDTNQIGIGNILASIFHSGGKDFYAFYFVQRGTGCFFDEKGQSLQRTFLKAPLHFSRISSRFTHSRMHPILKISRPHYGVDYSAPRGTPVVAIGDGKIIQAGWNGGYGRYIMIRHNSVYSTGYGHLSGYGTGIRAGRYVKQGEVVGYVGSSGLSTGPHLDFRVYKNGSPVNPLTMESPPAKPVDTANLKEYLGLVKKLIPQLDSIR